jgi:hypothetical protein
MRKESQAQASWVIPDPAGAPASKETLQIISLAKSRNV